MMTNNELATAIAQTSREIADMPPFYHGIREKLYVHLEYLLEAQRKRALIIPTSPPNKLPKSCELTDASVHQMEKQLSAIRAALNS